MWLFGGLMKKRESPDFRSPEVGISEDDGEIIVYQNVLCTCGYCLGHFASVSCH